jgi:hypothetical protein
MCSLRCNVQSESHELLRHDLPALWRLNTGVSTEYRAPSRRRAGKEKDQKNNFEMLKA